MTRGDDDRGGHDEHVHDVAIGVGMGGSCPVCRAPVDLGQEFCLECGSPIRFTPRQRRAQRGVEPRQPAATLVPPPRGGFPWVPFLVVLALIGGGGTFALIGSSGGDDDGNGAGTGSTETGLPTITNSQPEPTSQTQTTTLQDCIPDGGDAGTLPAEPDPNPADGFDQLGGPTDGSGGQIPELGAGDSDVPAGSAFDDGVPSTEPSGEETVTVNQNGQLCDSAGSAGDPGIDPGAEPGFPSPDPATTEPTDTGSGEWPAGKRGWTVIVAGYDTQERASQRAADIQEDGFSGSGVLFSTDYASLCPGIYVVFSGVFDSESQAEQQLDRLAAKPDYAGMYVREIRADGSRPGSCTSAPGS